MADRRFDLVIHGASGFTGQQAAAYLARHAPTNLRWAIAGRSRDKLAALGLGVPVLVADSARADQLDALALSTRVVLNMAGPFKHHGDALVAACVRHRTDYADISGETARIRALIDRHHAEATAKRVRVVNFCGVSSLPADLAVYLLDEALEGKLVRAKAAVRITGGSFTGGTVASIIDAIESGDAAIERDPFLLGPVDGSVPTAVERDPSGLRRDRDFGAWVVSSPMGLSDTRAVRRSAALRGRYVAFQEYLAFDGAAAPLRAMAMLGVLSALNAGFRWRLTRRLLAARIKPGQGPSEARMDAGSFALDLWGRDSDGRTGGVRIKGQGDPGNRVTVLCACESALALANSPGLPERFGVLTPSVAIGTVLVDRLRATGLEIKVEV